MRWSLDTHKYISETTRKALQIMLVHGITSQSSEAQIDAVERELTAENIYKDYESAKGRVKRALFTYFKAYGCMNYAEQLTEVGKAFCDNELSIQEFCFHFIVNYKFTDKEVSYYPVELILQFLSEVSSVSNEDAYITPYDFAKLVEIDSVEEINSEFINSQLEARRGALPLVEERKIGYDVWAKMLINAGILVKQHDRTLRVKNTELMNWILSSYKNHNESVKGELVTGILCDLPVYPYNLCNRWEGYGEEGEAVQAFLFEGVDVSIIEKYIKQSPDIHIETLLLDVGVPTGSRGYYRHFIGLEKLVAYRLQTHEARSCQVISSLLLQSHTTPVVISDEESALGGANTLLYGVPGCGKSFTVAKEYCNIPERMQRVVFHPEYTNSDFVGQILPISEGDRISYVFTPGPFTRLLKKAEANPQLKYYLVIEEINRGNAPAIFGEVFQLLDRNSSGASEYGISNADIAKEVYGEAEHPVTLPSNYFIVATMNTSDQNVFTLDTAFQRRWNMRMIENNVSLAEHASHSILDTGITWLRFNTTINNLILDRNLGVSSSEDKRLGAYFIGPDDLALNPDGNSRFPEKVLKYLWDDAFKFARDTVFDPQYRSLEELVKAFKVKSGPDRFSIFRPGFFER